MGFKPVQLPNKLFTKYYELSVEVLHVILYFDQVLSFDAMFTISRI